MSDKGGVGTKTKSKEELGRGDFSSRGKTGQPFQWAEVIIDRDDYFCFPLLPSRGTHKCFCFVHLHASFIQSSKERVGKSAEASDRVFFLFLPPSLVYS